MYASFENEKVDIYMDDVRQKNSIIRKPRFWIFTILIIVMSLGVFFVRHSMEFAFFGHISGLHSYIRLGTQYDNLVGRMGEPDEREVTVNLAGNEMYILHYAGIVFTVVNSRGATEQGCAY